MQLLLLFVVVVINLLGSYWLLSVSVLEVKASDWVMSQRPSAPERTDGGARWFCFGLCQFGSRRSTRLTVRAFQNNDPHRPEPDPQTPPRFILHFLHLCLLRLQLLASLLLA